jgi:chemotaxis protein methyltransferase CheR
LERAHRAVFSVDAVSPVPADLRRKYFMRSRDPQASVLRVVPELRRMVEFRRINFMDAEFGLAQPADAIFCRNVIIYFDRKTQEQILQKLAAALVPGGYIFVGHSESLHAMNVPLVPVAPAVYRKADAGA